MLRVLDHRLSRLALATAILAVLGWIAATRLLYRTSIEAVLNAPRVTLVAPVDGVVDDLSVEMGAPVAAGDPVLRIRRSRWSSGIAEERDSRAYVLRHRASALESQAAELAGLRDSLRRRLDAFGAATLARLASDTLAASAVLVERSREFGRVERLRQVDGSTDADVDRLRADVMRASAERSRALAAFRAARRGVILDPGGQDVPYSRQRLDEVQLRLADLATERAALTAELATLGATATVTVRRSGEADVGDTLPDEVVLLDAPARGVVWSLATSTGEPVLRGAPLATLIDCSRLFFEATVGPREQDRITPGMPVEVRFAGTSRLIPARVAFVRGGGVRETGDDAAQLQFERRRTDARVVVHVSSEAVGAAPGNFCQVGRSAKVIFEGPAAPWRTVAAWMDGRRSRDSTAVAQVAPGSRRQASR